MNITKAKCEQCGAETDLTSETIGWIVIDGGYGSTNIIRIGVTKESNDGVRNSNHDRYDFCGTGCLVGFVNKLRLG